MICETDRIRAVRAFKLRETRKRERKRLMRFLICLGAAELLIILVFFVR